LDKPRFFANVSDKNGNTITLSGDENIHLRSSLRLKEGDRVEVFFGNGEICECMLTKVDKKASILKIVNLRLEPKPKNKVSLCMAVIKSERMDWAVQKCTELGVTDIIPFESKFCTAKDRGNKTDRLVRIAISACKQSGRAFLPNIASTKSFDELVEFVKKNKNVVLAYELDKTSAKDVISKLSGDVVLIVGSEGGFDGTEVENLVAAGANCVSLGKNILRAETAAVALCSVVMYQLDFWNREKNE